MSNQIKTEKMEILGGKRAVIVIRNNAFVPYCVQVPELFLGVMTATRDRKLIPQVVEAALLYDDAALEEIGRRDQQKP